MSRSFTETWTGETSSRLLSSLGEIYTTVNDLVYTIAKRACELADLKMDELRSSYPETTETREELIRLCKQRRYTRGQMIQDILIEQFVEEEK